uniref:Ig-like domain-containing protein n=1 Tax=Elaeophora elaphi TaxID=1147741 RepID=A0A0R3S3B7_9BILA
MPDRWVLKDYGTVMCKEKPATENERATDLNAAAESEKVANQLNRTEDLEEAEIEFFDNIMRTDEVFEEYSDSQAKPTSSQNVKYEIPIRSGELMRLDAETERFQAKLMKFAKGATVVAGGIVAAPIVLAKLGVSKVCDSVSGEGDGKSDDGGMQMFDETASSMTRRDELKWMQSEVEDEESVAKLSERRISENAESGGVEFERVIPQKSVEEIGILREHATMEGDKQGRFQFAEEVIKGQVVEDSLTDTVDSWNYVETEFFSEASSDIDGVREEARNEAFLRLSEIQSKVEDKQWTAELAPAKVKEESIDTKPFPNDVLISNEISFADLVVGYPVHGADDMTGIEARQSRIGDRDLRKMGKSITSLTVDLLTKEKETMGLSREEIASQKMYEFSRKIQDNMENPPEYQLEENIICKEVTPVEKTEKMKGWSLSRFHSTTAFEQSMLVSPKEKEFGIGQETEAFSRSSPVLDRIQEYRDLITDIRHGKSNIGAEIEKKSSMEKDQWKGQQWKDEQFAEENGTVAREIILTPAALMIPDTAKICDYYMKSDVEETRIEQPPDADYLQLTPPTAIKQHDVMQEMMAEEQILKKETDYDLTKVLNKTVFRETMRIDVKEEVTEEVEVEATVASNEGKEEGMTVRAELGGNEGISFDEMMSEKKASYELDLDRTGHRISHVDERIKPFSVDAESPYEVTVDKSWTPEEKKDTDTKTGLGSGNEEMQKERESLSYLDEHDAFSAVQKVISTRKESFKDLFAPAKAVESEAAVILATSGVLPALEIVQVTEDQKSFLRSALFEASDSKMEEKKEDEKVSYGEEGSERHISSAEVFVESDSAIYSGVSDMLWQQTEIGEDEEIVSEEQLGLASKEESITKAESEKKLALSNVLDRCLTEQQECHEFILLRKKETEEDSSLPPFSSMFPTYAENIQTELLQEMDKRTESLAVTADVPQQRMEDVLINKFSHPTEEEYRELKVDVSEVGSVKVDDREKLEAIVEPTSELISEESLILTEAPLSRQKIDKGSSEMDEKAKIARGIDLEVDAEHLIGERNEKLDQTTSRSSSSYSVGSSIGKHSGSRSTPSDEKATVGKTVSHVQHEHEEDYESDLKEKLEMLAEETKKLKRHLEDANLLNEDERDEERLNIQVTEMVDDIMKPVESLSRSESTYKTATATSRDGYDTCVTSQEDTFETAAGYQSQESEYTTATSEDSSRLSEMGEERRESATPIAILSPVQSDRLFTASQDEEQEPNRQESGIIDSIRCSPDMPDIELESVEDEDNVEEDILLTTPSGILLAPDVDPERPVSPVPPGFSNEDEGIVSVAIASDSSRKVVDQARQAEIKVLDSIVEAPGDDVFADETFPPWKGEVPDLAAYQKSMHEEAMDFGKEYFPQYSDLSSENKTSAVHTIEKEDEAVGIAFPSEEVLCIESDSLDSLDKISVKSGSSGKKYSTSRRSSISSRKSSHDEPQIFVERLTPELKMSWIEKDQEVESAKQSLLSSSEEYPSFMSESEQINPVEVELETVDEEPEEADSLNGRSISSNGQGTDISVTVGKYKTVSSDNVSETSLQEFERIERDVLNKGESSLSGSEVELYVTGKLKTADGSTSSLAEFERLEQEVVAEGSPQDEVMILSDIREESEVEEMSIRDDDEEEHDSISDIKVVPVEEDIQVATPLASPTDSIERDFENFVPEPMGTSTDSLEINVPPALTQSNLGGESYLTEYEVIEKVHEDMHDSLEVIPQDKDSMLDEAIVPEISEDKRTVLSGDTYQEDQDEEKDSLAGDMDPMLHDYPTTLTTFETMQITEDGCTEIISRRVLTRVTDPILSHVQFTGTENERRLRDLEREEEFETVDVEGNVTRTTLHRSAPSSSAGTLFVTLHVFQVFRHTVS